VLWLLREIASVVVYSLTHDIYGDCKLLILFQHGICSVWRSYLLTRTDGIRFNALNLVWAHV
jgi:hypothetical protein